MKLIIVFAALFVTVAVARPSNEHIVRSESNVEPDGFKFSVETSDGSNHNAEGQLKEVGTEHEAIVVHGQYSFVADDGKIYTIKYIADENGFQPQGDHLPTGPDV